MNNGAAHADELLRNADVAMYAAKAEGKNSVRVFEPSMHTALSSASSCEGDLRRRCRRASSTWSTSRSSTLDGPASSA